MSDDDSAKLKALAANGSQAMRSAEQTFAGKIALAEASIAITDDLDRAR